MSNMGYSILNGKAQYRSERQFRLAKQIIYVSLTVFFYVIMRIGIFGIWQPVFIIPLAVAAAMYKNELPACLFALLCGYMTDIAYGFIFGFSAVWLMTVCVITSLLARNLIRVNIINFMFIVTAAVLIEFSMDYLFNIVIRNVPRGDIILAMSIIPTSISTITAAPAIYLLVKMIEQNFGKADFGFGYYVAADRKKQQGDED